MALVCNAPTESIVRVSKTRATGDVMLSAPVQLTNEVWVEGEFSHKTCRGSLTVCAQLPSSTQYRGIECGPTVRQRVVVVVISGVQSLRSYSLLFSCRLDDLKCCCCGSGH